MFTSRSRKLLLSGASLLSGYAGFKYATSSPEDRQRFFELDLYNIGAVRFGRAAITVASIGLDYKSTLSGVDEGEKEAHKRECHQRSADKLLKLCCDNGGCFIKVGQHIGALDYLLPDEYVQTLRVLHHRAPEMPLKDVYSVIREDLGRDPEEVFSEFDPNPLGTASLAQVHKAKLKDGGEEVAVKVQHRHVKNHSFIDIVTMDFLVRTIKVAFPQFEFMWLAEEMKKNLPLELSFTQEARNAERVSIQLEHLDWLKIPEIHWKLTTDRVLTMEYCPGGHINDLDYLREHKIDPYLASTRISRMYAEMIFKYGYVHCDPHPGNVLVQKCPETRKDKIVLLDHGLYSQLTHEFRVDYARFWLCILNADTDGIRTYADKLGVGQLYGLFACMVAGRSWDSIRSGIDRKEKNSAESKEIKNNAQRYIRQIADVLAFVNRQMILIFKTNDLLRAIEHSLGTSSSMQSFIQMSRACFRCLNHDRYRRCGSTWGRWKVGVKGIWDQFRISCYQVFLWVYWTRLAIALRK